MKTWTDCLNTYNAYCRKLSRAVRIKIQINISRLILVAFVFSLGTRNRTPKNDVTKQKLPKLSYLDSVRASDSFP